MCSCRVVWPLSFTCSALTSTNSLAERATAASAEPHFNLHHLRISSTTLFVLELHSRCSRNSRILHRTRFEFTLRSHTYTRIYRLGIVIDSNTVRIAIQSSRVASTIWCCDIGF